MTLSEWSDGQPRRNAVAYCPDCKGLLGHTQGCPVCAGPHRYRPTVIGLTGRAGSGKSFIGDILVDEHRFTKIKFADALKNMVRALFAAAGCCEEYAEMRIEGTGKEEPLGIFGGRSTRYVMQTLGTEWGRNLIHPDLWVKVTADRVALELSAGRSVVIDDVRFDNEARMIHEFLGVVYRVDGISSPLSYEHVSEAGVEADGTIDNTGRCPTAAKLAVRKLVEGLK